MGTRISNNNITEAINKLSQTTTVKLENNKDEIIQSLRNEASLLQNRVGKLENEVRPGRLLNVLCTFNFRPVSTGNADQYSRRNNIVIRGIQSD